MCWDQHAAWKHRGCHCLATRGSISPSQAVLSQEPRPAWPHLSARGAREQYLPLVNQLPLQGVHEIRRGRGPATVQNHLEPGDERRRVALSPRAVCLAIAKSLGWASLFFLSLSLKIQTWRKCTYLTLNPLASTPANRSEPISEVSRTKGASFLMENLAFFGRKLTLGVMTSPTEQLGSTGADGLGWGGSGAQPEGHRLMRPQREPSRIREAVPPRTLVPS